MHRLGSAWRSWRHTFGWCVAVAMALAGAACGGAAPAEAPAPPAESAAPAPPAASAAPASSGAPGVFFVIPQDGATVAAKTHLMFGSRNFAISAVPPGELTETRPDLGHYHVAIDTDCLPAGTVIPKAEPWVHFGDGGSMIDMQLPSGTHRLTLQVGDDLHRAIEGLCQTIAVTVGQ